MLEDNQGLGGNKLIRSNTIYRTRGAPPGAQILNLFEEASKEAYRHKWIESENLQPL